LNLGVGGLWILLYNMNRCVVTPTSLSKSQTRTNLEEFYAGDQRYFTAFD
jgi:hypothetical protein